MYNIRRLKFELRTYHLFTNKIEFLATKLLDKKKDICMLHSNYIMSHTKELLNYVCTSLKIRLSLAESSSLNSLQTNNDIFNCVLILILSF